MMVTSFPAVQYCQLFHRRCDNLTNKGLKESKGSFSAKVGLTASVKEDLQWWIEDIEKEKRNLVREHTKLVIETEASNIGLGALYKRKKEEKTVPEQLDKQ